MDAGTLGKRRRQDDEGADRRPEHLWGMDSGQRQALQAGGTTDRDEPRPPSDAPLTPAQLGNLQRALSAACCGARAAPAVPASALDPLLGHLTRMQYLASLVPDSALAPTASYFHERVTLQNGRLVGASGPAPHLSLANLHKFAARLDVPPHDASDCASLPMDSGKGVRGPNAVDVLRIDLGTQETGAVALHTDTRRQRCALLEAPGVRPHTLVLRGVPCLYGRVPAGLLPLDALVTVRSLTLVLDHRLACEDGFKAAAVNEPLDSAFKRGHDPRPAGAAGLLATIPPCCERVTIVFYTGEEGVWDPPAPVGDGLCESWAGTLFAQLAHGLAALPSRPRLLFVNAGAIDPAAVLATAEHAAWMAEQAEGEYTTHARVESALELWFERNWRAAAAGPSPVQWVSMFEWARGSEWGNVFDEWEIARWRDGDGTDRLPATPPPADIYRNLRPHAFGPVPSPEPSPPPLPRSAQVTDAIVAKRPGTVMDGDAPWRNGPASVARMARVEAELAELRQGERPPTATGELPQPATTEQPAPGRGLDVPSSFGALLAVVQRAATSGALDDERSQTAGRSRSRSPSQPAKVDNEEWI